MLISKNKGAPIINIIDWIPSKEKNIIGIILLTN
jgi:hypothetical protein